MKKGLFNRININSIALIFLYYFRTLNKLQFPF